ncbi:hypothetical protein GCM10023084_02520 [Streptomyces lacrimifluminis]|uniref:hypothetical protein n=1 Tax=Streptomyces lacrimifluminis TaxID=1500077 RepID=UPI0031ED3A0B
MPPLSLAEVFFLALGTAGFLRFGCCLVYLIADEEPMPAWLDKALDVIVGAALATPAQCRRMAVRVAAALALLLPAPEGATR